jgi:hypothetical protein
MHCLQARHAQLARNRGAHLCVCLWPWGPAILKGHFMGSMGILQTGDHWRSGGLTACCILVSADACSAGPEVLSPSRSVCESTLVHTSCWQQGHACISQLCVFVSPAAPLSCTNQPNIMVAQQAVAAGQHPQRPTRLYACPWVPQSLAVICLGPMPTTSTGGGACGHVAAWCKWQVQRGCGYVRPPV